MQRENKHRSFTNLVGSVLLEIRHRRDALGRSELQLELVGLGHGCLSAILNFLKLALILAGLGQSLLLLLFLQSWKT